MVFLYGTMYLLLTTFNSVFQEAYNESVGIASLNYISWVLDSPWEVKLEAEVST